jgi:hypothetical protein
MIDYLKYRKSLWRLSRQREKIRSAYAKDIRLARAEGKKPDEIRSIESGAVYEETMTTEKISILDTRFWAFKSNQTLHKHSSA